LVRSNICDVTQAYDLNKQTPVCATIRCSNYLVYKWKSLGPRQRKS